jgi:protein-disulfide isomerase
MAKRQRPTPVNRPPQGTRQTNWVVIGGVIGAGFLILIALLVMATRETEAPTLADYCTNTPDNCIIEGAANAPVTVVEISDYNCIHCRNFNVSSALALHEQYVETGQVRWIVLPFGLRATTVPPAAAALCAADQGQEQFSRMHLGLFSLQEAAGGFSPDNIMAVAAQAGLDMDSFTSCYDSGQYTRVVEENIRQANLAGISATPSFFINGLKLEGNQPLASFQQRIDAALAAAGQ